MIILAPKTKESAYIKAAEVFQDYYEKITGISLDITDKVSDNEDMVVIGSEAVQPFVYESIRGGLSIKLDSDEYCILSQENQNRTILFLAGGRGRSTLYAVYDFFERRGGCHYFWDGDVIPQKDSIDIKNLDIVESPRFTYRAIRYFAHRGLGRFQAEHWDFDEWKTEIDWVCKSRLNVFMLRIGIDDLFQKAFPDIVSYPSNEEILPEATTGYNNRTTFWPLQYRGQLRKRVMDYAFSCDLIQPEDCGTMTHWYSRTPKEFLNAVKPGFLSQISKSQSEQTGLVWDVLDEKNLENYQHLTDTHVKEYGKPEMFHTIGLAERTYHEDRQKNLDLKKYVYSKITNYISSTYPNAPLLIAAWDFFFALKPEEVRDLTKLFNPEKHIIFDYTVDLKEEENDFEKWDIMGKLPWIFGIFHAYEPQNHIHGDYEYIAKKLEIASQDPLCKGMAFWPETSHSDILMLEYFKENAWKPSKRSIDEIATDLCLKRYGEDSVFMLSVWKSFLPLLKLPMKERMPSFVDILKTNAVFLRMFDFKDERRKDCEEYWSGCEDYELGFETYMKQIFNFIIAMPDEVLNKPFVRRDISDIMKVVVMLKLQYRFIKLSFSILRWYRGADEADAIRELLSYNEKMLSVFSDVLGVHEDNSMYDSLVALSKNRPVNPYFENTLKDNVINWYCRTGTYEAAKGVYQKEFAFFKDWMLKLLSDSDRENRNTDDFEKVKERIFEEFKQIPLKDFHREEKPSIKEVSKRFLDMLQEHKGRTVMELKDTLKNIYKNLEKFDFSKEQEQALYDYGKALSENEELLSRAAEYYTMIFEDKDTVDASELEEHDGLEKGMLFAIIFLARCKLLGEVLEKDGIPRQYAQYGIWHYKNLFERNKQCYGHYGFCGIYRDGMVNYVKPKTFTLGRLSFEMNVFSGPYEVYQNKKSGALIPIAVASLRYLANGKPAPQGASDFFETTLSVGETIEGYTFYEDGTLNFERIILHKDEYEKVLKQGDPVLSVHIPEMGKMTPESVQESFEQAREFFGKYYSHKNFKAFVCSSWLLDTGLKNFFKPESNIMAFQKNFRIALSFVNTFSIYWHIFGVEKFVPYSELVPKNSFQKKILDYVLGGGFLYSGNGFIMF